MDDYKISNNRRFSSIFKINDNFSKYTCTTALQSKNAQTRTDELSNILTKSERKPINLESDRGCDIYTSIFQNVLKTKNIHHYSRFTDEGPSIMERVIKPICNFFKKPKSDNGNVNRLNDLPSVINQYNNTIHNSTKMKPIDASEKAKEKSVFSNLKDNRQKHKPKLKLGQLVRTADTKRVFNEGDSTNWSYSLYTKTEVIYDTIPSNQIDFLPENYKEKLLRLTNLTFDENNQVMQKLKLCY